ncbi:serine/threonine-protein kinase [Anabaena subtropica]|uniref:non-specific serine/threonine protein kinase n=1 Tax=Anabaena subtropica FACHB-260 TaxID=2692884 RepID=A0ABR8CIR0_9NOST|nr:serine/threonine-protein kinase [Anabaena subtropica]MBD2343126.1 serine/threonine protein kinase [Anabaena subtropica FACHB-260]
MEVYCTRPRCLRPKNHCPDLDDTTTLKTTPQKYCTSCGMPLLLDGRYVPINLLKRGGFGAAFLARDRRIPGMPLCVVKQLQPAGNLTPEQLETAERLFETEAEVLAYIGKEHAQIPDLFAYFPVIVSSLQSGLTDQFFYLVQEYIDGQNLEDELIQKGKFSEQEALEVMQEVLKILKFIHDKKIIHRDIKPSNIMRRQDGRLFLLDFGAVKQVTAASVSAGSSTGIYTVGFAAPEQIAGNLVFPATDIYALAATILNLLSGEEPSQLFDPYINKWTWWKKVNINPDLSYILDRMLLPAVNERFQSANEVLDALGQYLTPPTIIPKSKSSTSANTGNNTTKPVFSTWELLAGAAFSGFEAALVAIALSTLIQSPIISLSLASVILGLLIFAQTKRWIKKFNLLIIAVVSFATLLFIPEIVIPQVVFLSVAASLIAIAITALFRLIYKFLSRIM